MACGNKVNKILQFCIGP